MTQIEAAIRFRDPLDILDPFFGTFSPSGFLLAEQKTRNPESSSHKFTAGCACAGCCGIASASDDVTFVTDFTALISGSSMSEGPGTGAFFTYSFPDIAPPYLSNFYTDAELATFEAFSEAYKELAREAVEAFVSISGLTAFEVSPGKGDVQFMVFDFEVFEENAGAAGFAYYPSTNAIGSDIFIDDDSAGALSFELLLHELGHALGLKHPFEGSVRLETDADNTGNTVMSYSGVPGAEGLGPLDMDAIVHLYGDEDADGNQIASWSWDEASETLTQTGDDTDEDIRGVFSNDVIEGLGGDDTLRGGGGDDQLFGGSGRDVLFGGDGSDVLRGGIDNDDLFGQIGDDELFGEEGADYLDGGEGDDILDGGAGDDTLFGGEGDDLLEGGDGSDYLDGGSGIDILRGGGGDDTIALSYSQGGRIPGGVQIDGGSGFDTVSFFAFDLDTTLNFQASTLSLSSVERIALTAGSADDVIVLDVDLESFLVNGEEGDDLLVATSGTGRLSGDAGDDTLVAGTGVDFLFGGAGADRFVFDGKSASTALDQDQIEDFETGVDTIELVGLNIDAIEISVNASGSFISIGNGDGDFHLFVRGEVSIADFGLGVLGTGARDDLLGSDGSDRLFGENADDTLTGGLGNDLIDGGAGSDTAIFSGNRSDYAITQQTGGAFLVVGPDGSDRLVDTEFAQFDDQLVSLTGDLGNQPDPPTIPEPAAPDAQMLLPDGALIGVNSGSVSVIGTSDAAETVRLSTLDQESLAVRLDPSFNRGGDTLVLPGTPGSFSAARTGSSVTFFSDNHVISVPVGVTAMTVRFAHGAGPFDDETRDLVFDTASSQVMLGDQVLTAEPVAISDAGGAVAPEPVVDRSAAGTLTSVVLSAGSDTLGLTDGNFTVVGTATTDETVRLSGPQETALDVNFDPSFNAGGDRVALAGNHADFTVARAGSSVTLSDGIMTVSIPVGTSGLTLAFDDGEELVLLFDTDVGEIMLGDQVVTSDPGPVVGLSLNVAGANPAFDVASLEPARPTLDDMGLEEALPLAVAQNELSRIDSFVAGG